MNEHSPDILTFPAPSPSDALTAVLQKGARQLLADAVEIEVETWLGARRHLTDEAGRRQVVRNGHLPERQILTGIGKVTVQLPRVHDRRPEGQAEKFTSAILPPYLRKAKAIEELIPWLYLRGISTGDFGPALSALLGPDAMLIDGYDAAIEPTGSTAFRAQHALVGSPATGIAGGTDQIQRNIIGDRVLGLPREPAVDRGVPWNETLRS